MKEQPIYERSWDEAKRLLENREVRILLSQPYYREVMRAYRNADSVKKLAILPICGATIDINSRCNGSCRNCIDRESVNHPGIKPEMPWAVLRGLVIDFAALGCRFLEPMGGEPMLHTAYDAFLNLTSHLGIALKTVSNGSLAHLHIPALVRSSGIPGTSLRFSINGGEESYPKINLIPDAHITYRKILSNIEQLVKEGVAIIVSYVVFPENRRDIYHAAKAAKDSGASSFLVLPGRDVQTKKVLAVMDDLLCKEMVNVKSLGDRNFKVILPETFCDGAGAQPKHYRHCACAFIKPAIGVEGHLFPCTYLKQRKDLVFGRIDDSHRFGAFWQSEIRVRRLLSMHPGRLCEGISCTRHYLNSYIEQGTEAEASQIADSELCF